MTQKKKALRQLVRKIKIINRTIENDNLWRGRFCVRLKRVEYRYYPDNSGIYLIYWYNMIDKKFGNMLKSSKMRKAKELEEINDYDFN